MSSDNRDTDVRWTEYGLRAEAINRFGGEDFRCRIEFDTWSDSSPGVSFARQSAADSRTAPGDWRAFGTGALGAPQNLRDWLRMFEVFQDALATAVAEISTDSVSPDQVAVFDRRTGDPHPVFGVPHRPERHSLTDHNED